MASVLHGSARTTPRLRGALQASQESSRTLAVRYDLNPKTVRKWRKRTTTADAPMGPRAPKSTVLTPAEEASVVAFPSLPRTDAVADRPQYLSYLPHGQLSLRRHQVLLVDDHEGLMPELLTQGKMPARLAGY